MPVSSVSCAYCHHLYIEHQAEFGFCQHAGGCKLQCPRFVELHPLQPDVKQHFEASEESKVRKRNRERTGQ